MVEWILEKMGKKRRENVEGKLFGGCLVEREREGNDDGAQQKVLSKMERKLGRGKSKLHMGCCKCFFCLVSHSIFFRHKFFFRYDFYFLINLGDCTFFLVVCHFFCFKWASFNKSIRGNLYELIFFILLLFHYQTNKNKKN